MTGGRDSVPRQLLTPKVPPHSEEAEMSVLGGLMLDSSNAHDVFETLGIEDFYYEKHRLIYTALRVLSNLGRPTDFVTITDHLRNLGKLDDVDGMPYLGQLVNETPGVANVMEYARIVKERATLRALVSAGDRIAEMAFRTEGASAAELLQRANMELESISVTGARQSVSFRQMGLAALKNFENAVTLRESGKRQGMSFGLDRIDSITGGLHGPKLIVIAARPKCGKTALLNKLAINAAWQGMPGLVCSMEMGADEIVARTIASSALLNVSKMQRGNREVVEAAAHHFSNMPDLPLHYDFESNLLEHICAQITHHRAKHHIQWAAVDHIGLMSTRTRHKSTNDRIGEITGTLKLLTKRLNIPIIALSQLGRGCDIENRKPRASDLRDSGNIEQDADMVIMLHVPQNERLKHVHKVWLGVTANRAGPSCWDDTAYDFDGPTQRFLEADPEPSHAAPTPESMSKDYGPGEESPYWDR